MPDATQSIDPLGMYRGGYATAGEPGFAEKAFFGIPAMLDGRIVPSPTKGTGVIDETPPYVWCHRAQEMLLTSEARSRFLPNGVDSLTADCGCCTCCLN